MTCTETSAQTVLKKCMSVMKAIVPAPSCQQSQKSEGLNPSQPGRLGAPLLPAVYKGNASCG